MLCIVLANLALVNCAPLFGFNVNKWINHDILTPASFDDEVSDFQVEFEERNATKKSGDLELMANNSSDSNENLEIFSFTSMTSTISPVNVSTTTTTMSTTSSSTTYMPSSNSTETSTRNTLQPSVTTLASTSTSTVDPKKMTDFGMVEPIDDEPIPNAFNFSADGLTTSHPSTTQMPSTSMRPSVTMFSTTSIPSRHQTAPTVTAPTSTTPASTSPNKNTTNINSAGKASSGSGAFRVSALAGILIVFTSCRLF